jgi:2-keto-4-pentenoate hydratase
MLSTDEANRVAQSLLAARERGESLVVPSLALTEATDAYRIQDAVARAHGGIDGWKVGAKGRQATPTCAPLLRGTIVNRSEGRAGEIPVRGETGLEVEIAFALQQNFPASSEPGDRDILDAVTPHIAVELCHSRLRDPASAPPLWLLADNQQNECLVVGPPLTGWPRKDSTPIVARLAVDDTIRVATSNGHPAGDPHWLLLWLVRHCLTHRGGVRSGQIITTGSWTGMLPVRAPAWIGAEFIALGALSFAIAHSEGRFRPC